MFVCFHKLMKIASLCILVATSLWTPPASAAPETKERPRKERKEGGRGGDGKDALFAILDADKDGALTVAELRNAAVLLRKLDRNGDGNLTHEELSPPKGGEGKRGKGKQNKRPKPTN